MNKQDRDWLINQFPNHRNFKSIDQDTIDAYMRAEMILHGWNKIKQRGCKCQWKGVIAGIDVIYDKWLKRQVT
tara:strand:- start:251 stop:469 length:219 start_codon:yes stop_codon:yes gene_type:complete